MPDSKPTQRTRLGPSRRRFLERGAAAVVGGLSFGPWFVRDAFSSSGELNLLLWRGYLPEPVAADFTRRTGIRVNVTTFGSEEELTVKMQATRGRGFDLISPSAHTAPIWRELGLLRPFETLRTPLAALMPQYLRVSTEGWRWDGGLHHLPYLWGTEALAWRRDKWHPNEDGPSYGDLWQPSVRGAVMGRPHSMMLGIGLWLDATGRVPSGRMRDTYASEDVMRDVWSEIMRFAADHRDWIRLFWDDVAEQRNGFLKNDVTLAQTLEGPSMALEREGEPVSFRAPREGALAWLDGLSIPAGAANIDQIYAFLNFVYDPEVAATVSSAAGGNPVVTGAQEARPQSERAAFAAAFPGDALENLWWWPAEPIWYTEIRKAYRDRFIAAI